MIKVSLLIVYSTVAFSLGATQTQTPTGTQSHQILAALFKGTSVKIDPKKPVARAFFSSVTLESVVPKKMDCGKASVRVIATVAAKELDPHAKENEILVLTATECEKYSCHACGAFLATARLTPTAAGFEKLGDYKFREDFGEYGKFNFGLNFVRLAPKTLGIQISVSSTSQGYTEAGAVFYALTPEGELKGMGRITDTISNSGTGMCFDSELADSPKDALPCIKKQISVSVTDKLDNGWYQILSTVKGLDDQDGKMVTVNRTDVYRFSGGSYELKK